MTQVSEKLQVGDPVVLLCSNTLWSLNSQSAYAFVLVVSVFYYKTFHLCRQMHLTILTKSFLRNYQKFTRTHSLTSNCCFKISIEQCFVNKFSDVTLSFWAKNIDQIISMINFDFRQIMSFCWSRCIIYIYVRKPQMKNFGAHKRSHGATLDIGSVYNSFFENASELLSLDALPI